MLTADEARQLDRFALGASRIAPAVTAAGLRRTRMRGSGIEFQDYRHYQPGDDPRSIDWTVEARLQQLVIRVSRGDGQLKLHLLVDVSASMTTGTPDKLWAARKLAAALCYVAVERRDAVGIATFTDTITSHVQPAAGRPQMFRVFEALRTATGGGQSDIDRALTAYAGAVRGGGLVVVLSDFFQPGGALQGLQYLLYRGLTPAVVQIVAPEEVRPDLSEDVELVDIENPSGPPVVVDAAAAAQYAHDFARASSLLGEFCASHGLACLRVESTVPFEAQVHACMHAGLMSGPG